MLFMDEIKSKVNMHPSNHVNSNWTWQNEANHMLFTNETKLKTKHACEQVRFKSSLASWSYGMPFIAWNRIESKHVIDQVQFRTNQANWS
jgi:hypothetical protein